MSPISAAAGTSAFAALIWWVVPTAGLFGAIGYVIWVSKFKSKFESETFRSVGQFQRFQESFREQPIQEELPPTISSLPEDQIR